MSIKRKKFEYCLKYYSNDIFKYCTKITYCCIFFMNKWYCSKHQSLIIFSESNNFSMTGGTSLVAPLRLCQDVSLTILLKDIAQFTTKLSY